MSVRVCRLMPATSMSAYAGREYVGLCRHDYVGLGRTSLCRSTLTRSTSGHHFMPCLDPIRGSSPDISPRSCRGPTASDEGPRQLSPTKTTYLVSRYTLSRPNSDTGN